MIDYTQHRWPRLVPIVVRLCVPAELRPAWRGVWWWDEVLGG